MLYSRSRNTNVDRNEWSCSAFKTYGHVKNCYSSKRFYVFIYVFYRCSLLGRSLALVSKRSPFFHPSALALYQIMRKSQKTHLKLLLPVSPVCRFQEVQMRFSVLKIYSVECKRETGYWVCQVTLLMNVQTLLSDLPMRRSL